jgi:hypothetical protein
MHTTGLSWFRHTGRINLECLVEPIMAKAAAARESGTIRTDPVVAGLHSRLRNKTLGEHGARGE